VSGEGAIRACLFDVYGTLIDFNAWVARAVPVLGAKAGWLAATWRSKQLEYAWVSSLSHRHADFWACTVAALDYSLELHGIDRAVKEELLAGYRDSEAFADAAPALRLLREAGVTTAILSNGTPEMLRDGLGSSGLSTLLDHYLSIEAVQLYKPSAAAYELARSALGLDVVAIGFVSANAWDVMGASRAGLRPVWVNRYSLPDEYGLRGRVSEVRSLLEATQLLAGP